MRCRVGIDGEPQLESRTCASSRATTSSPAAPSTRPALLLRSNAPDPHARLGRRTFLHPVVLSSATFEQRVEAWAGAPQTIYSDHFLDTHPIDGPLGYKLEAPPMHPVILATTLAGFGPAQAALLRAFPHTHALIALLRDGFHRRLGRRHACSCAATARRCSTTR